LARRGLNSGDNKIFRASRTEPKRNTLQHLQDLRPASHGAIMMLKIQLQEAPLSELDPIAFPAGRAQSRPAQFPVQRVTFERRELDRILNLYGRKVAAGEWRDYAIQFLRDRAVFAVFRRASEMPLYRIVKDASLARRQGAYAVVAASGRILKRGHDLDRVLRAIDPALRVVN
jgi:hypothetical protein